jgi:hypothetical protein
MLFSWFRTVINHLHHSTVNEEHFSLVPRISNVSGWKTHVDVDSNILRFLSLQRVINQLEVLVVLRVCVREYSKLKIWLPKSARRLTVDGIAGKTFMKGSTICLSGIQGA